MKMTNTIQNVFSFHLLACVFFMRLEAFKVTAYTEVFLGVMA
jgi:hypothetical protein